MTTQTTITADELQSQCECKANELRSKCERITIEFYKQLEQFNELLERQKNLQLC